MFGLFGQTNSPPRDKPFRDDLLGIEGLPERALALAATLTVDPLPRRRTQEIFSRFDANVRILDATYRTLVDDARHGGFVPAAAEWLLDNFHLITSEVRDIRRNLPRSFYLELPTLASRDRVVQARIYAMAVELIRHSDSRLDRHQLGVFVTSYQRVAPLTIGELWAWPSMLRLALVESLRRLAEEVLDARRARLAADEYISRIDADGERAGRPMPADLHTAYVVQLLHRIREHGPAALRIYLQNGFIFLHCFHRCGACKR